MERYIKRSDGKIQDLEKLTIGGPDGWESREDFVEWLKENEDIDVVAKSDNIENLCDEFIVDEIAYKFGRNKPYLSEHSFHAWADEIDFAYECGVNLYLGIWVDGELRKFAKMKRDGNYCLIKF